MATKKKAVKAKIGRPSAFKPAYIELAKVLASGEPLIDEQLAKVFGVSVKTLNTWKTAHPAFLQALKEGKEGPDREVEDSLFKRANGYEVTYEKPMVVGGSVQYHTITEHYPPDPTSMIFWLKNRRPKEWRDKQEVELGALSLAVLLEKPLAELLALKDKIEKGA